MFVLEVQKYSLILLLVENKKGTICLLENQFKMTSRLYLVEESEYIIRI